MINGTRYRLTMEINRQTSLAAEIARAQTEISTGKRVQTPSDDPVAAARIADIGRAQATQGVWKANLDLAYALSARADTVLAATENAIGRAQELMVTAANGTLSASNRAAIALELHSIVEELNALKDARDARGDRLFPAADVLHIPVGPGVAITAVTTRTEIFESVATAAGPRDIAAIVADAAAALEEPNDALRQTAVGVALDEMGEGVAHVATMRGAQGARGNRIDQLSERMATSELQLKEERSALEDADVTAVVARLQARQLTLQAAQAVFARVNQTTLFDVLG